MWKYEETTTTIEPPLPSFVPLNETQKGHLIALLGFYGKMVGFSKSMYSAKYPDHLIVFNGNLVTESHGKIWYGDMDLNFSYVALKVVAKYLNEPIFVLYEGDARFDRETNPAFERFVMRINPDGLVVLNDDPAYDFYRPFFYEVGKCTSQPVKKPKQETKMPKTKATKTTKRSTKTTSKKSTKTTKRPTGAKSRRS